MQITPVRDASALLLVPPPVVSHAFGGFSIVVGALVGVLLTPR